MEMESVDVMAGADAATSGRPLIEVIDEGQDPSRTLLPLHQSPLSSPILPPTLLMLWMRATAPPPHRIRPLLLLFALLLVRLGLAMGSVAFALKPKVRVGLLVFVSARFLSLCLASTFCRKLLLANQKVLFFSVVLLFRSLICSSGPQQLHSIF